MSNPSYWKVFCQWCRDNEPLNLPENISLSELNRFAARYRLARAFNGIDADGYAKDTMDAYSAVLKVFLAYSALEQFHKAVKPTKPRQHLSERWADCAVSPAVSLRESEAIIQFLIKTVSHNKLKEQLIAFQQGKHDNVLIVATALRHAVAHGFMSVHPEGTSARVSKIFCQQLSRMLLSISNQSFVDLLKSLSVDFD
jgi:hypothetical protein